MSGRILAGLLTVTAVLAGCKSFGPSTIPRDRSDYSTAMNESWKRQILLNIIRLRYLDPPSFVDVGQIVAGYSLETQITAGGQVAEINRGDTFAALGGRSTFTDRPTITYAPLTGNRFIRGLMTPIPPESLFYATESSWAADAILKVGLISINGLKNEELSGDEYEPADPKFLRVTELMRRIQKSGAVGMRVVQEKDRHETKVISFRFSISKPEVQRDIKECQELLGVAPGTNECQLVFGSSANNDHEIAVQTRSLLQIIGALAARAEVPLADVRNGAVTVGVSTPPDSGTTTQRSAAPIRCTKEPPKRAFVSVQYRDHWFWVDDNDIAAKRRISFMMLLFTLADTSEKEAMPLITIPAQ
jgi:hypothetical protein